MAFREFCLRARDCNDKITVPKLRNAIEIYVRRGIINVGSDLKNVNTFIRLTVFLNATVYEAYRCPYIPTFFLTRLSTNICTYVCPYAHMYDS